MPTAETDRVRVLKLASAALPCWKCGEVGHQKADCPLSSMEGSSTRPTRQKPPTISVDVSGLRESERPFHGYCQALLGAVQQPAQLASRNGQYQLLELVQTKLHSRHDETTVTSASEQGNLVKCNGLGSGKNRAKKQRIAAGSGSSGGGDGCDGSSGESRNWLGGRKSILLLGCL